MSNLFRLVYVIVGLIYNEDCIEVLKRLGDNSIEKALFPLGKGAQIEPQRRLL